jgi:hypothetical protein
MFYRLRTLSVPIFMHIATAERLDAILQFLYEHLSEV